MTVYKLPPQPTPFIGREEELSHLLEQINHPDCRLLTLVGLGGIGKTRLALEIARQARMTHGTHFVDLEPLNTPDLIVSTIADAIGFRFYPGDAPTQQLLDHLRSKTMLLVLDNFEHLLEGRELLSRILEAAPGVKLLTTSREVLNLQEEWVHRVEGLSFPSDDEPEQNGGYSAVQLFTERAMRARGEFCLDDELQSVIRICQMVGGMPLGIELAAARVRVLPCKAIADEIARNMDVLETQVHNVSPRHRTMRAVFEPSWAQLSEAERTVFIRLSVFHGCFTREAAEFVAGASLQTLSALVDRSMIRMDAYGRYDVHELLCQYAMERLQEQPEALTEARNRHCQYFTALIGQKEQALRGENLTRALEDIQIELDNIRVAWQWAVSQRREDDLASAVHALWQFYDIRSLYQEGAQAFRTAAEVLRGLDPDAQRSRLLGKILAFYGGFCFSLNQRDAARSLLEESLAVLRRYNNRAETAFTLLRLSSLAMFLENEPLVAQDYLHESLALFREVGDDWGTAYSLCWLGYVAVFRGKYEEARALSEESLVIFERTGNPLGRAIAQTVTALSRLELGDYHYARQTIQTILALCQEIGLRYGVIQALILAGAASTRLKDYSEAKQYLYKGLCEACKIQFAPFVLEALLEIAHWLSVTGATESKVRALEILGLLLHHPIPTSRGKHPINLLLDQLEQQLPDDVFAQALERGRLLDLQAVADTFLAELRPSRPVSQPLIELLTEREFEVLRLLAQGMTNEEIADALTVATGTIKAHNNRIFGKLDAANRTQAVARARELNLL